MQNKPNSKIPDLGGLAKFTKTQPFFTTFQNFKHKQRTYSIFTYPATITDITGPHRLAVEK